MTDDLKAIDLSVIESRVKALGFVFGLGHTINGIRHYSIGSIEKGFTFTFPKLPHGFTAAERLLALYEPGAVVEIGPNDKGKCDGWNCKLYASGEKSANRCRLELSTVQRAPEYADEPNCDERGYVYWWQYENISFYTVSCMFVPA